MEKNCAKCCQAITGIDCVTCRGYCGSIFHMTCSGVSRALLGYFTTHRKNLYWMCDKCAELFENSHFRSLTSQADEKSPVASLTDAINNLRTEIKTISSKPVPATLPPKIRWPVIGESPRAANQPREAGYLRQKSAECQSGSKQLSQNVISVPVSEKPVSKFWLYLSRIRPDVTNDAISGMVKANLGLSIDPEVVRLVAKGTDTSNMSFVSFKVGLDPALKNDALDPSTWPEGIMFREFEDYTVQKFRRPSAVNAVPSPTTLNPAIAIN